jgi:hypothetical protein
MENHHCYPLFYGKINELNGHLYNSYVSHYQRVENLLYDHDKMKIQSNPLTRINRHRFVRFIVEGWPVKYLEHFRPLEVFCRFHPPRNLRKNRFVPTTAPGKNLQQQSAVSKPCSFSTRGWGIAHVFAHKKTHYSNYKCVKGFKSWWCVRVRLSRAGCLHISSFIPEHVLGRVFFERLCDLWQSTKNRNLRDTRQGGWHMSLQYAFT